MSVDTIITICVIIATSAITSFFFMMYMKMKRLIIASWPLVLMPGVIFILDCIFLYLFVQGL